MKLERILMLADSESSHTRKWAKSLAMSGIDVCICSLNRNTNEGFDYEGLPVRIVGLLDRSAHGVGGSGKLSYLLALPRLKKIIREFQPNILHAHYASSYGLLGALSFFKPYILSVWGSDVYSFPRASILHREILKFNFRQADVILSTSHAMASETQRYTAKRIEVTPFGVDMGAFRPLQQIAAGSDAIIVGTVKSLEKVYGIDVLIRAFKVVRERNQNLDLKLVIVGKGSQLESLKDLSRALGILDLIEFVGGVPHSDIPTYHNLLSIEVFASYRESFGVSVVEASACERPVIVSNVGGLPEVVEDGVTGFVVPSGDVEATAMAIEKLAVNPDLRAWMGRNGRKRVEREYVWDDNVKAMLGIYQRSIFCDS